MDIFKGFHVAVERKIDKLLKCLRSDNGGEYSSNGFDDYCTKHGIKNEKTIPYSPQLNGMAERMNRTLTERSESLKIACYLVNVSPSHALESDVPQWVLSDKKVNYSHLRVFSCKAFVHVHKEQWVKLVAKAVECIFLGHWLLALGSQEQKVDLKP